MTSFQAYNVYAKQLSVLPHGLALWFPEPQDQKGEIQIGDVGYLYEGQLIRLFNVTATHRESITPVTGPITGPVDPFEPEAYLQPVSGILYNRREGYLEAKSYSNGIKLKDEASAHITANVGGIVPANITGSLKFTTTAAAGAILRLPGPATLEEVIPNKIFVRYMRANHQRWYEYATNVLGITCKPEEIVFVRGTVKTTDWTVAAFQKHSQSSKVAVDGTLGPIASAGFALSFEAQGAHLSDCRSRSKPQRSHESDRRQDQCVFLRLYMAKYRIPLLPPKIEAAAGPHQLPPRDRDRKSPEVITNVEMDPEVTFDYAPVQIILDYILHARPEAEVAIACEGDITDLLRENPWPRDLARFLAANRPYVDVDIATKTGMLSMEFAIQKHRTSVIAAGRAAIQKSRVSERVRRPSPRDMYTASDESDHLTLSDKRSIQWPHTIIVGSAAVVSTALSPDGIHIAMITEDSAISIWRYEDGVLQKRLADHKGTAMCLAYSPDGRRLASRFADGLVVVLNVTDEGKIIVHQLRGHESALEFTLPSLQSVAISPDGKYVAAVSFQAHVWDAETGKLISRFDGDGFLMMQVLWAPDSTHIVSRTDRAVQYWSIVEGKLLASFSGHLGKICHVDMTKKGDRLATCSQDRTVRIWNTRTGRELVKIAKHTATVYSVAFSPNGYEVVSGGGHNQVIVADSYTGKVKHILAEDRVGRSIKGSTVFSVAFSHDGALIVSGNEGGNVRLWDNRTGTFIAQYETHTGSIRAVQFAMDDMNIISSSNDGSVRVFNVVDTLKV